LNNATAGRPEFALTEEEYAAIEIH